MPICRNSNAKRFNETIGKLSLYDAFWSLGKIDALIWRCVNEYGEWKKPKLYSYSKLNAHFNCSSTMSINVKMFIKWVVIRNGLFSFLNRQTLSFIEILISQEQLCGVRINKHCHLICNVQETTTERSSDNKFHWDQLVWILPTTTGTIRSMPDHYVIVESWHSWKTINDHCYTMTCHESTPSRVLSYRIYFVWEYPNRGSMKSFSYFLCTLLFQSITIIKFVCVSFLCLY